MEDKELEKYKDFTLKELENVTDFQGLSKMLMSNMYGVLKMIDREFGNMDAFVAGFSFLTMTYNSAFEKYKELISKNTDEDE